MQAGESLSFFIIFFEKAFLSLDLGASFQGLLWRISNSSRIVGFLEYAMGTIQQTEGLSRKWDSLKRTALYFISKTYLLFLAALDLSYGKLDLLLLMGSSLRCVGFSLVAAHGVLEHELRSHGAQAQLSYSMWVLSSPIFIGRCTHNHWTTREVPKQLFKFAFYIQILHMISIRKCLKVTAS